LAQFDHGDRPSSNSAFGSTLCDSMGGEVHGC
jgi:hypothetical protein